MRSIALVWLVVLAQTATAEVRPAVGGERLFAALERAPVVLVARVDGVRKLDAHAHAAEAVVEQTLRGSQQRGDTLRLAWEELSPSRPARFAEGGRVLLALGRLSGASIWRQRIPDPQARVGTFGVAERGNAFVRDPAPGAVQLLEHFLALSAELREDNPGVAHLVRLAESAQPVLAGAAIERLDEVGDLDAALDPRSSARVVTVLLREPSSLGQAALELVGRHRPEALREPLQARAAADGSAPAVIYDALARLDGELPETLAALLLQRDDSAQHRAVGARHAPVASSRSLVRLLRDDPAPEVRANAVARLVEQGGVAELDRVLFALGDADPTVRSRAMLAVADLGDEAVPGLRSVVENGTPDAARTAVGALRNTGPEGLRVLQQVARDHPDESVRTLASIALGGHVGHQH